MLVARAFVLGIGPRSALAILVVALSVAYAILTGAATGSLRGAETALEPGLLETVGVVAATGGAPFPAGEAPGAALLLTHGGWEGMTLGTVKPWPYHSGEALPGPYVRAEPHHLARLPLPVGNVTADPHAPWDWVLVPPEAFDALLPSLAGKATLAMVADVGAPQAPGASGFYRAGADQVRGSVHLIVLAMGVVVAVVAGSVLRLEVLAREQDVATLEAIAGPGAARRAVTLRTLFLVGLGVVLGAVGGSAAALLVGRALGAPLHPDPFLVAEASGVAAIAGLATGIAGGLGRLRTPLAARLGRRGPGHRPFRGPVRFLLVTPRLVPSVFASAVVLTSVVTVVLAAASVPHTLFSPAEGVHIVGQSAGNPFRGAADRFLAEHAGVLPGINVSSPETVAPTVVLGRPVVVRGVVLEPWLALDHARLVEGRWPAAPGEALAGARAARVLGLSPGDAVLVPAAYRTSADVLTVVGVHAGAGLADDELITDLDTAGGLAALPPDTVHLTRIQASPAAAGQVLQAPALQVLDIAVRPERPVPHTAAVAHLTLLNLGGDPAFRVLTLRVNGEVAASAIATVPGRSRTSFEVPFVVPDAPSLVVEVNPTATVSTAEGGLRVQAPESVPANATFSVRVLAADGSAVPGARVEAGGATAAADAEGSATLAAGAPGTLVVHARSGTREGGRVLFVVEPEWALSGYLVAERLVVTDARALDNATHRVTLLALVVNAGGAAFAGALEARADGAVVGQAQVQVGVRQRAAVTLEATVPAGTAAVEVAGAETPLPVLRGPASAPVTVRTVADVLAEKRIEAERAQGERALGGRALIEDLFQALTPSVTLVVLATFFHAGAGVVVAVTREVRERGQVVQVLGELGAGPDDVAARAARDAFLSALPGIGAGAAVGLVGLLLLQPLGFPAAFGHTIPVSTDPGLVVRVVGALGGVALLTAAWAARTPPPESPRQAPAATLEELGVGP